MISASLRHEAEHAKLVFWDSPKGRGWGEKWEGGSGWGLHMYTGGQFMLMYGKKPSQYCKILPSSQNK